ncbi:sugar kinase [Arthrobacter pigmenti]
MYRPTSGHPLSSVEEPVDAVTVGEAMMMVTPTQPSPLEEADTFSMNVGGAESNVAMYLAGLGHRVSWLGNVGNDPLGRIIMRELHAWGVDTIDVSTEAGSRTGVYFKDPGESRTNVYYYRDGSAATLLSPEVLKSPCLSEAQVLHLSGITAALSQSCLELLQAAINDRVLGSKLISFDVNYRPGLWSATEAGPLLAALANRSDLVFVGLDEAQTLWGCESAADVREVLPKPDTVVLKDDARGASSLRQQGNHFVTAPHIDVVEPVGAGDAFAAGYLAGLLRGIDERDRLRMGHLLAAQALGVTGDQAPVPPPEWFLPYLHLNVDEWQDLRLQRYQSATAR